MALPTPLAVADPLRFARDGILAPAGLDEGRIEQALGLVLGSAVDSADIYFQLSRAESWGLEDGIVKEGSASIEQGVGVRALAGEKTGFAYSDEIMMPALEEAARAARAIAVHRGSGAVQAWRQVSGHQLYRPIDPRLSLADEEKIAWLERIDRETRRIDPRVVQVMASLGGEWQAVQIMRGDGTRVADLRPLVRLNVSVVVERDGRRETGTYGTGGRYGYDALTGEAVWRAAVDEALRQALVNLDSRPAPAGEMEVVLGSGWPGILLHEAIGHGLEGDFNRKKTSAFAGLLGQRIAVPGVTVVDDGTLPDRRGSLTVDDEGTPTNRTVLIEDGILVNFLQDRLNARLMNMQPTGNGRRQSHAHAPMPRMTNTVMLGGPHTRDDMIRSVKRGLYAVNFGGGQVDITSGKFVFSASEAYLIEDGKVTAPVKGATLIGNGPDALTKVMMVGDDMALDPGVGTCGKSGQGVPVGVGQPTLKLSGLTVGGTAA